jgi:hypothetical protein
MNENDMRSLVTITATILEVVGKDKVKYYSKWQLQSLAFRIRNEAEQIKRILDKPQRQGDPVSDKP